GAPEGTAASLQGVGEATRGGNAGGGAAQAGREAGRGAGQEMAAGLEGRGGELRPGDGPQRAAADRAGHRRGGLPSPFHPSTRRPRPGAGVMARGPRRRAGRAVVLTAGGGFYKRNAALIRRQVSAFSGCKLIVTFALRPQDGRRPGRGTTLALLPRDPTETEAA